MRTVDLFSGCGGMSLGFQSAGYNIVAAFENWPAAIECYKQNFKHPVIETDLSMLYKFPLKNSVRQYHKHRHITQKKLMTAELISKETEQKLYSQT